MGKIIRMSWYKIAKDFSERNFLNQKIRYFNDLLKIVKDNSKIVFQSGKTAKDSLYRIVISKEITSYPILHDLFIEANSFALDNPWKFQDVCSVISDEITYKIAGLEEERRLFIHGDNKKQFQKGLVDNYGK